MSDSAYFARRAEEIAAEVLASEITADSTITLVYRLEDHDGKALPEVRQEILSHRPSKLEQTAMRQAQRLLMRATGIENPTDADVEEEIRQSGHPSKTVSKEGYAALARHQVAATHVGFQQTTGGAYAVVRIVDVTVEITHLGPLR
jgi:hypothetical protein